MSQKSAPKGFSKGLITDVDPRYQLEGSYRDAMNVRVVNTDGTTFTIENINGNRKVVDLHEFDKTFPASYSGDGNEVSGFSSSYFAGTDFRPTGIDGQPMSQAANIVGHFSFRNELVIIVCGYIFYGNANGSQSTGDFRTAFFKIVFNGEGEVEKFIDLRVAYNPVSGTNEFPNLNMHPFIKCRVEGIIENDAISRIYWTDNKNPLRTFSLNDPDIHTMNPSELDITPKATHNQIALKSTISGSLPVGVYQYCYKYITDAGSESGISPLSNIYHISNTSSASSATYYGGTPGSLSNDGFLLKITNLDTRFDAITIYAVYYNSLGAVPQVSEVATKNILADAQIEFKHTTLTTVIENGVENILIPTNTWDVCKDIAIKDNVLFAANLRQKRNFVTEKEWNVKVLRYKLDETTLSGTAIPSGGSLTTTDSAVKDYYHPSSSQYSPDNVVEAGSATSYVQASYIGYNIPSEHRYLPTQGTCLWGNEKFAPNVDADGRSRRILGGVSYAYYAGEETNRLGGCMFSFRQIPKISDTRNNRGGVNSSQTEFISTNVTNPSIQTDNLAGADGDNNNVDTEYTASFTIGSNKDPHASGNKRGYQRSETYRFGVLVYDKNGDPGNVLWIGDIKMPNHYDKAWELDLKNTELGRDATNDRTKWRENPYAQDYRISAHTDMPVPGHGVQYDTSSFDFGYDMAHLADVVYHGSTNYTTNVSPQMYGFCAGPGESGYHYTLDLAIDFTFKIPPHVREKISGFRVVRAERTESDRTIIQSGLVNQVCNYGRSELSHGYVKGKGTSFDGGIGAEKVQAGDTASIVAENTDEIYDRVLNGYAGVNAGSNSVVVKDGDGKPRFLNESESNPKTLKNIYGAGSGEFGSYGKMFHPTSNSSTEPFIDVHTQARAGLMYSPDSTFGIRPYAFSGEDKLQWVSILKLYNEERMNNNDLQEHGTFIAPSSAHGFDSWSGILSFDSDTAGNFTTMLEGSQSSLQYQALGNADNQRDQGLIFSTKKITKDNESGVMVAKCAVLDTYYEPYIRNYPTYNGSGYTTQLYVSINGVNNYENAFFNDVTDPTLFADSSTAFSGSTNPDASFNNINLSGVKSPVSRPSFAYNSAIENAKEIGQGEFVPKDFFTQFVSEENGGKEWYIEKRGFSNFSLGARYLYAPNTYGHTWMYGKITDTEGVDLAYETVSTLQMGTRAILINTNKQMMHMPDVMQIIRGQSYLWNKSSKPFIESDGLVCAHSAVAQPYYYYANIYRFNDAQYGGDSLEAIQKTRWVNAGNFHPINIDTLEHHTTVLGGDTFVGLYSHQMTTSPYPEKSFSKWVVFPCESFVNTEMRSGLHLAANDHVEGFDQNNPPFSNDWFYNDVYSQENNLKSYLSLQDDEQQYTDLPVEIAYSKTKLSGEQTDAFRIFPIFNFYDVEAIYGQINRIINFQNEIHFFQENAFGQLLVNPRTFLQDTSGVDSIFTGSGDTIESHQYISIKYGTKHMHSVVASERNLFFFDIRYAKLLKYGSDKKLVSISDDLGTRDLFEKAVSYGRLKTEQRFYDAIRVSMCDMPLYFVGIHGAFDYSSNTLYMTFADRIRIDAKDTVLHPNGKYLYTNNEGQILGIDPMYEGLIETGIFPEKTITSTTVSYNEDINAVISKYSVYPQQWIEHNGRLYTPQSQLPWGQYFNDPGDDLNGYEDGFRNSNNNFGQGLTGVYGPTGANMSGYRFSTHELSEGNLTLWEWDAADEKTRFFGQEKLHNPIDQDVAYANDEYGTNAYPIYDFNNQEELARRIIHKSYIEKVITDAPGENKKFDNLNVVVTVKSKQNLSNNILAYLTNPDLTTKVVRRDEENLNSSMYFEDLQFESESFPRTTIGISTTNTPGYPSTTQFNQTLHKYREGVLRIPLRSEQSKQRVVGTYMKATLSARTTEKFNIFAIMAKYRKSYN